MKRGMPERQDIVVCKIMKLYPHSAEAKLLEYQATGMIHVSEVASRWVRDIREFLKENQYVVCRVMGKDAHGLSLSIKRVRREEANRTLMEYKREKKAEAMLEQIAKGLKKSREQAFEEVGYLLQEEFGSLTKAFQTAAKNPDLLKEKNVPSAWRAQIVEVAQKKFAEKTYLIKGDLELFCPLPDGVEVIRTLLLAAQKKGFQVSYISAPRYRLSFQGKDPKRVESSLKEEGESLVKAVQQQGGDGTFVL